MSYERYDNRRRTTSYGASSRRTTFGYWVPLAFTVTVATLGVAAWIWKERRDNDEYEDGKDNRPPPSYGDGNVGSGQTAYAPGPQYLPSMGPPPGAGGPPGPPGPPPQGYGPQRQEEQGMVSRVTEVLRRTPSPQQILDEAGRRVTAGVAAAGAAVGSALSSIREEDRRDYEDHSRWSEEAVSQQQESQDISASGTGAQRAQGASRTDKRRTVAIVVSSETQHEHIGEDVGYHQEHASILSHLPEHMDEDSKLFVLIYAPDLKQHPMASNGQSRLPPSITSSYSNIAHDEAQIPGDEHDRPLTAVDPQPIASSSSTMYEALAMQARALVERETMIMPFTTPTGYIHMLRQIAPQIVYVQATLSGESGEHVKNISGWVGQVVLVVGDESGHGGLVDSEDERGAASGEARQKWWQNDGQIGLGQIEVVEGLRMGDDWRRRVKGHD